MLGKLLKYDLKWTYKGVIVFYILAIMFSVIGRLLSEIENSLIFNIIGKVCIGTAIAMVVNVLINNLIRVWVRFIRNSYKDESYLTHTLPVNRKTIFLSKVLSAIITMITSAVIIVVCVAICYYSEGNIEWVKQSLEFVASTYNSTVVGFLLIVITVFFLEMIFALFAGYIGIIFAHKSNNLKTGKSVLYGFMAYMIPQSITIAIIFILGLFNQDIMNLLNTTTIINVEAIKSIMYAGIVIYLCYITIYYLIGKKQFEKGVNVD